MGDIRVVRVRTGLVIFSKFVGESTLICWWEVRGAKVWKKEVLGMTGDLYM